MTAVRRDRARTFCKAALGRCGFYALYTGGSARRPVMLGGVILSLFIGALAGAAAPSASSF